MKKVKMMKRNQTHISYNEYKVQNRVNTDPVSTRILCEGVNISC
jgi:hypothetical protein